jgi:hypothetical protein
MVGIIASRAAAFRLTWIIAALLIPILFLGYFMVSALQRETSLTQNEADGAVLIQKLYCQKGQRLPLNWISPQLLKIWLRPSIHQSRAQLL